LGENLADYGGVTVSFTAFTHFGNRTAPFNGLTDAQRFFIAYAMGFTQNIRDAEVLRLTKTNEHSLGRWRVNGALPHIDMWYEAFGVKEGDKMYIPKEKRLSLW
jgi:putative endopeptidase